MSFDGNRIKNIPQMLLLCDKMYNMSGHTHIDFRHNELQTTPNITIHFKDGSKRSPYSWRSTTLDFPMKI